MRLHQEVQAGGAGLLAGRSGQTARILSKDIGSFLIGGTAADLESTKQGELHRV